MWWVLIKHTKWPIILISIQIDFTSCFYFKKQDQISEIIIWYSASCNRHSNFWIQCWQNILVMQKRPCVENMKVWAWLTCQGAFCNCHRRSRLCGKPSWDVKYFFGVINVRGGEVKVFFFISPSWSCSKKFLTWFIPQSQFKSDHIVAVIVAGYLGIWVSGAKLVPGFYWIGTWVLLNICSAWKTFPPHLSQIMNVINIIWMVLLILWCQIVEIGDDDGRGTLGILGLPPQLGLWQCLWTLKLLALTQHCDKYSMFIIVN